MLVSSVQCLLSVRGAARQRTAEHWQQRFKMLQKEEDEAQKEFEKKETAYKEHVEQRLKSVEVMEKPQLPGHGAKS